MKKIILFTLIAVTVLIGIAVSQQEGIDWIGDIQDCRFTANTTNDGTVFINFDRTDADFVRARNLTLIKVPLNDFQGLGVIDCTYGEYDASYEGSNFTVTQIMHQNNPIIEFRSDKWRSVPVFV